MYSEKVMDHFANPRNSGEMENPDGVGTVGNPTCGDLMTIYILKLKTMLLMISPSKLLVAEQLLLQAV